MGFCRNCFSLLVKCQSGVRWFYWFQAGSIEPALIWDQLHPFYFWWVAYWLHGFNVNRANIIFFFFLCFCFSGVLNCFFHNLFGWLWLPSWIVWKWLGDSVRDYFNIFRDFGWMFGHIIPINPRTNFIISLSNFHICLCYSIKHTAVEIFWLMMVG